MKLGRLFVGVQLFGVVMFLGFAAVQFNDPDPVVWIAFYGAAAAICGLSCTQWFRIPGAVVLGVGAAAAAVYLATRVIGKQHLLEDEEGREMLGLALTALWMLATAFARWRKADASGG